MQGKGSSCVTRRRDRSMRHGSCGTVLQNAPLVWVQAAPRDRRPLNRSEFVALPFFVTHNCSEIIPVVIVAAVSFRSSSFPGELSVR